MTTRACTKCGATLPATTEFFRPAQQGRLRGECKECTAKDHAARYQREREKRDATNREWVRKNPEARKGHTKAYREKNKDKCNAAVKTCYKRDIEKSRAQAREKTKKWYQNNLERARALRRAAVQRRRALKKGAKESRLTHAQWVQIQQLYDHCCAYCGKRCEGKLTQDHVIPLTSGGPHTVGNVVPACMTCNCSKKAGSPPVPIAALKFLPD